MYVKGQFVKGRPEIEMDINNPVYVDCQYQSCTLLNDFSVSVEEGKIVDFVTLPRNFKIDIKYYMDEIPPTAQQVGSMHLQSVYEIYSVSLGKPLLEVYRERYAGLSLRVWYLGEEIEMLHVGPYQFEFGWHDFSLEIRDTDLIIYGKTYSEFAAAIEHKFPIQGDGAVYSEKNIIYASQVMDEYRPRAWFTSGLGRIKDIFITGGFCCASTSYYTMDWESCVDGGNNLIPKHQDSCTTCITYQCLDWLPGSVLMTEREDAYNEKSGDNVYFGVGAAGRSDLDAGKCFRIELDPFEAVGHDLKEYIVQAIDVSHKAIPTGSFQMMAAGGGFEPGAPNGCVGAPVELLTRPAENGVTNYPQFDAQVDQFGWDILTGGWDLAKNAGWYKGGFTERDRCEQLPEYPLCSPHPMDNQQTLCEHAFDTGLRVENLKTRTISKMCEVRCPDELVEATGLKRMYEINGTKPAMTCPDDALLNEVDTKFPSQMSFYMNCARPRFANREAIQNAGVPMAEGQDRVVPCRRDGYSRINSVPTLPPTPMPTHLRNETPSSFPTSQPSSKPSGVPTWAPVFSPYPTLAPNTAQTRRPTVYSSGQESLSMGASDSSDSQWWDFMIGPLTFVQLVLALGLLIGIMCCAYFSCMESLFQANAKKAGLDRKRKWKNTERIHEQELLQEYREEYEAEYYSDEDSYDEQESVDDVVAAKKKVGSCRFKV